MGKGRAALNDAQRRAAGRPAKRKNSTIPGIDAIVACPEPPEALAADPAATAEWNRVGPWLIETRRIAELDRHSLAAYCIQFSLWQRSCKPLLVDRCDLWGFTDKGESKVLTVLDIFGKHGRRTIDLARRFGMSPRTRHLDHADTGRPALPDELHSIRGNPSRKRLRGKVSDSIQGWSHDDVAPPHCLGEVGKKEYMRLVKSLSALQLFTPLDLAVVSIAAGAFAVWSRVAEAAADESIEAPALNGLTVEHPIAYLTRKLLDLANECWKDCGMSPLDRRRFKNVAKRAERKRLKIFLGESA